MPSVSSIPAVMAESPSSMIPERSILPVTSPVSGDMIAIQVLGQRLA